MTELGDKFALIVNIGGYFVNCGPVVEYICGSLKSIYGLDADRFGYFDLQEEIKKLGVNKYEKIVYRIPNAGVGADSLRDVIDDKGVMEIISCGKNNKTIVQIYVVGGDIIDDEADENVEASFQTKSSSQQDTDDGEEVNGLSQAEASIEEEPADQLEDINDIIDNFTSVEHGEGDAETNNACAGLGSQESSDDEDYFPTGVSSSDDDLSDDHLSDDDEYVQARKNLKESRKKVQDWDDDAGYTHPMATAEMDFEEDELLHNALISDEGRPRQHTAPHTVVQPPQTETMTSPPSETMTSPPVERLTRPPVQRMTTRGSTTGRGRGRGQRSGSTTARGSGRGQSSGSTTARGRGRGRGQSTGDFICTQEMPEVKTSASSKQPHSLRTGILDEALCCELGLVRDAYDIFRGWSCEIRATIWGRTRIEAAKS
ncbi:DEAD/DEAH box RNA helicase family protein [Striga asiatica]|uniref:DEAD/DEAH box RNA helicase family protein n=1 Tax=Striga asiatica TaxID=4170 RepID=A0A5A7PA61_STRAF|nr:DEAD/DEAH box RNA helicase family protein [Striga asiatica]